MDAEVSLISNNICNLECGFRKYPYPNHGCVLLKHFHPTGSPHPHPTVSPPTPTSSYFPLTAHGGVVWEFYGTTQRILLQLHTIFNILKAFSFPGIFVRIVNLSFYKVMSHENLSEIVKWNVKCKFATQNDKMLCLLAFNTVIV